MFKFVKPSEKVLGCLQTQGYNTETIVKAGKSAKVPKKTTEKDQVNVDLEQYKEKANVSLKKIRELKDEVTLISKQIDRHHIKTEEIKKELNDATDEKRNDIQLIIAEMELVYSNLNTKRGAIKLQIENEEIFYKKICELDRFSQGAHNNQHEVAENNPTQHLNDHENGAIATHIEPNANNTVIRENKAPKQTAAAPLISDLLGSPLFNRKKVNPQQPDVNSPVPEERFSNTGSTDSLSIVNENTASTIAMDLNQALTNALVRRNTKQKLAIVENASMDQQEPTTLEEEKHSFQQLIVQQRAKIFRNKTQKTGLTEINAEVLPTVVHENGTNTQKQNSTLSLIQELDSLIDSIAFQEAELDDEIREGWGLATIPEERESIVSIQKQASVNINNTASFFERENKTASLLEFEREEKLSNLNHS